MDQILKAANLLCPRLEVGGTAQRNGKRLRAGVLHYADGPWKRSVASRVSVRTIRTANNSRLGISRQTPQPQQRESEQDSVADFPTDFARPMRLAIKSEVTPKGRVHEIATASREAIVSTSNDWGGKMRARVRAARSNLRLITPGNLGLADHCRSVEGHVSNTECDEQPHSPFLPAKAILPSPLRPRWYDKRNRLIINQYYRRNFTLFDEQGRARLTVADLWSSAQRHISPFAFLAKRAATGRNTAALNSWCVRRQAKCCNKHTLDVSAGAKHKIDAAEEEDLNVTLQDVLREQIVEELTRQRRVGRKAGKMARYAAAG